MKTIKMLFAAILFAAAGFTVSAYTAPKVPDTEGWFKLMDPYHPNDPESYEFVGETEPCDGEEDLCAIYGTKNPSNDEPTLGSVNAARSASQEFTIPSVLVSYEN